MRFGLPPKVKLWVFSIRVRVFTGLLLFMAVTFLFIFLLNYSGFSDWNDINANMTFFIAVSANIVLLTAFFYMVLRNLFRLLYERKKPLGRIGLKTKLIIAFVALSLPSTAFHLMGSGFMSYLVERWSRGEQKQVMNSAQIILDTLSGREEQWLGEEAESILKKLPPVPGLWELPGWVPAVKPLDPGGVLVYNPQGKIMAQWFSSEDSAGKWIYPAEDFFSQKNGVQWKEHYQTHLLRRILLPYGHKGHLLEVFQVFKGDLSAAEMVLARKQWDNRFLNQNVYLLILGILFLITLFIILAATWISFYLARGFVTPIEKLEEATRKVSSGFLGYRVEGGSLGPLEQDFEGLVSSFNAMSGQLNTQHQQLVTSAEELRESHNSLGERNRLVELLLENIDAGIFSLDNHGRITTMNQVVGKMIEGMAPTWKNTPYKEVLPSEVGLFLEKMLENIHFPQTRGLTRNLTLEINQEPVMIEIALLAMADAKGAEEGFVVIIKDVSQLQRTQRAMAWREVARRIAHEIKNPLTPIQLSAQRIRRKYLSNDKEPEKGTEFAEGKEVLDQCTEMIIKEVTSLKKMVNEFSQFAKLPESNPVLDDINLVIQEVAGLYKNGLPENVEINLALKEELPPFALDREQMKRVFTNLIDNAVASIPSEEKGLVSIRTLIKKSHNSIVVEVSDNGSGVPAKIKNQLFEPYITTKEGGTGLGLSIVNQIVSDHQGYIRYSALKPHGSQFAIEFRL